MWRYALGGVAAPLMIAAGWLLFNGKAAREPLLPPAPDRPQIADADGPGVPEASERTREQKRFDRYDKDRDGRVMREEYLASRRKAFAKLDGDGDGRLSFDEWAAKTMTRFATADGDRSGALDRTEFATTAPKRRPKPACVCPAPSQPDGEE
ncbi:EF-hand domain-containing protein [Sphingomonas lycopersici]|uniref:EF-hand domain-containing protein n=1 Tax=Sphingomonas lycopersici TaxID=2951807 RepID=A0AA41ZGC5_9SPHN|nr:EF-hand domain-containing protein [Sphingomonas lycopersici]MCW6536394.1 EF-hand domain-containing protein [Sphingomonas lycopersici]